MWKYSKKKKIIRLTLPTKAKEKEKREDIYHLKENNTNKEEATQERERIIIESVLFRRTKK